MAFVDWWRWVANYASPVNESSHGEGKRKL